MRWVWRLALLIGLVLVTAAGACARSGRIRAVAPTGASEFPVIPWALLPMQSGATVCSYNNLPLILVDSAVLRSADGELVIAHESFHARRITDHRGGCWPYMQRYTQDLAFRRTEELAAYCHEGALAIRRNRTPESAWRRIQLAMMTLDTLLTDADNCLWDPWPR